MRRDETMLRAPQPLGSGDRDIELKTSVFSVAARDDFFDRLDDIIVVLSKPFQR